MQIFFPKGVKQITFTAWRFTNVHLYNQSKHHYLISKAFKTLKTRNLFTNGKLTSINYTYIMLIFIRKQKKSIWIFNHALDVALSNLSRLFPPLIAYNFIYYFKHMLNVQIPSYNCICKAKHTSYTNCLPIYLLNSLFPRQYIAG